PHRCRGRICDLGRGVGLRRSASPRDRQTCGAVGDGRARRDAPPRNLRAIDASVAAAHRLTIFPVYEGDRVVGTISVSDLSRVAPADWDKTTVGELADRSAIHVTDDCDLSEAMRLLVRERGSQMLLVTDATGALQGIVTKTDILRAVKIASDTPHH